MYSDEKTGTRRILVFGGTGFIGRHLVHKLVNTKQYSCVVFTRNYDKAKNIFGEQAEIVVYDYKSDSFENFIKENDIVVNCLFVSKNNSNNYINDNKNYTSILLSQLADKKVLHVIHISTATVAGRVNASIVNEDTVCNPATGYQKLKYDIEKLFTEFSRSTNTPVTVLRPTEVFGKHGAGMATFINEVNNRPRMLLMLKLIFLGNRYTHYIHIDKVIHSILFILNRQPPSRSAVYIVSDDGPWNILKNVFLNLYPLFHDNKKLYVPVSCPVKIAKLILFLLGKGEDSGLFYDCKRLGEAGLKFETTFEEDIRHYVSLLVRDSNGGIN